MASTSQLAEGSTAALEFSERPNGGEGGGMSAATRSAVLKTYLPFVLVFALSIARVLATGSALGCSGDSGGGCGSGSCSADISCVTTIPPTGCDICICLCLKDVKKDSSPPTYEEYQKCRRDCGVTCDFE
jgi:hypothetical protein